MNTTVDAMIPDLAAAITYLFTAYQKPLDDVILLVYEHQLSDVPFPLVQAAVLEAPKRLAKPFVPSIREVRDLCDVLRCERLAASPFEPCALCRDSHPGWDVTTDPWGVQRLVRCECWHAYRHLLRTAGLLPVVTRVLPEGDA